MKLYFAAMMGIYYPCAVDAGRPPLLISFWDASQRKYDMRHVREEYRTPAFLDSGAFSAMNSGAKIDIGAFAAFYQEHSACFEAVANLDVIGNPRASERNLVELRARGVPAAPVWHLTSSLAELDALAREHERFAIGGMVPYSMKTRIRSAVLVRAWDIIQRHWPRRVHAFGVTDLDTLVAHPWCTADSSSAVMAAAYGRLLRWDHAAARVREWTGQNGDHPGHAYVAGRRIPMIQMRATMNIGALLDLQHHVTAAWREKGIVWNE